MNMAVATLEREPCETKKRLSGQLRQKCPVCNGAARVRGSMRVTPTITDYWVQCMNVDCGLTWKSQMQIVYSLSPSAIENADVSIPEAPQGIARKTFRECPRGDPDLNDPRQIAMFDQA